MVGLPYLEVQKGRVNREGKSKMWRGPSGVGSWLQPSQRHFVGCAMEISIVCCKSISKIADVGVLLCEPARKNVYLMRPYVYFEAAI